MINPDQQPTLPGLEGVQPPAADSDASKVRPLGEGYEQDEAERRAAIAEQRGEDLAAEQTGFKPDIVAHATGTSEPPRMPRPKQRRRGRGGYGPDYGDDPRVVFGQEDPTTVPYVAPAPSETPVPVNKTAEAVIAAAGITRARSIAGPNNVRQELAIEAARQQRRKPGV